MQIPVLLPNIFNHPFTYEFDKKLSPGTYVKVPFGKKDLTGVVWNLFEKKTQKKFKLKKIKSIIEINPLRIETINFLNWFSNYNLVPIGMCLKLHLIGGDAITKLDDARRSVAITWAPVNLLTPVTIAVELPRNLISAPNRLSSCTCKKRFSNMRSWINDLPEAMQFKTMYCACISVGNPG